MATDDGKENDGKPPSDTDDGKKGDKGGGNSGGNSGSDKDTIRQIVKEELAEALKDLKPGAPAKEGEGSGDDSKNLRRQDIEASAESIMRQAAEKIAKADKEAKEHEQDHENLRKPAETAPKKMRRLTKALWGGDDE